MYKLIIHNSRIFVQWKVWIWATVLIIITGNTPFDKPYIIQTRRICCNKEPQHFSSLTQQIFIYLLSNQSSACPGGTRGSCCSVLSCRPCVVLGFLQEVRKDAERSISQYVFVGPLQTMHPSHLPTIHKPEFIQINTPNYR